MISRLRIRSLAVPLTTLCLLVAQLISPTPVWKGLLTAFTLLWLLSYLWARALQRNIRLERLMRFGWAQVGDRLEERISISNPGFLAATWLEIRDRSTMPGYRIARATGVDGQSQNTWHTSGVCQRRGIYTLGHTSLVTGDPLGIHEVELTWPEEASITVLPPIIPLPHIEIAAGGWQSEGHPQPRAAERTVHAESVRPYEPGDSLRLIHWPTSARQNQPYVRILEGAPSGAWWIALDLDRSVQANASEAESTVELGVILAASLAERGLGEHQPVGLAAGSQPPAWIRPYPGEGQRWQIMRQLAMLQPGDTGLAALLETAGPMLGRRSSLVIITPSTQGEWIHVAASLNWRGIRTTVILIDPQTFGRDSSIGPIAELLSEAGINHYLVGRDLLDRPEA
ncbi:MAG TPA: DUF58 domain-containing protein, partial [Anaerolineales bacterium]|nr:DUF58 domain-containing protein [Anaerolineales bacterium]